MLKDNCLKCVVSFEIALCVMLIPFFGFFRFSFSWLIFFLHAQKSAHGSNVRKILRDLVHNESSEQYGTLNSTNKIRIHIYLVNNQRETERGYKSRNHLFLVTLFRPSLYRIQQHYFVLALWMWYVLFFFFHSSCTTKVILVLYRPPNLNRFVGLVGWFLSDREGCLLP